MAKIQWTDLPPVLLDHLFDRARQITGILAANYSILNASY